MEDLKKWIGRKFLDFCKSDPDDEREIHYEMMTGDAWDPDRDKLYT